MKFILLALLLITLQSCGSFISRMDDMGDELPIVYPGVRFDMMLIEAENPHMPKTASRIMGVIDLPFSLAIDTVLLFVYDPFVYWGSLDQVEPVK